MGLFGNKTPKTVQISNPSRLQPASDAGQVIGRWGAMFDPNTGNLLRQAGDGPELHEVIGRVDDHGGAYTITDAQTGVQVTVDGYGTPISAQAGPFEKTSPRWRRTR